MRDDEAGLDGEAAWVDWAASGWTEGMDREIQALTLSNLERLRRIKGRHYIELLRVISLADPIGLLRTGCPPDEYIPEADRIFDRLPEADSMEELRDLMHSVFVEMFDALMAGPVSGYEEPARLFRESQP